MNEISSVGLYMVNLAYNPHLDHGYRPTFGVQSAYPPPHAASLAVLLTAIGLSQKYQRNLLVYLRLSTESPIIQWRMHNEVRNQADDEPLSFIRNSILVSQITTVTKRNVQSRRSRLLNVNYHRRSTAVVDLPPRTQRAEP